VIFFILELPFIWIGTLSKVLSEKFPFYRFSFIFTKNNFIMETESKVYNIYPDEVSNIIIMDWEGYATSEQFREGTETMLNLLIEQRSHKALANIRDMVLIGAEDQKWMETNFLPRAIRFGFKACAIVKPLNYFNKVAVETISFKVEKEKLQINFFDTTEEAKAWLENLKF
jgi:hypothetical protein